MREARFRGALLLLACGVFAVVQAGRVRYTHSDAQLALLSAQALVERGSTDLRVYLDGLGPARFAHGTWKYARERDGSVRYVYPLGTTLLALPAVAAARVVGLDMVRWDDDARLQIALAGLCCAVVFALLARLARLWLAPAAAVAAALALTLGSSLASTLGSALWSFDFELVLLLLALDEIARVERGTLDAPRAARLGALTAAAWTCRPSALAFALPLAVYVAWRAPRLWPRLVLGALAVLVPFVLLCQAFAGGALPGYYAAARWSRAADWSAWGANLAALLFSPARGLFVFTPVLLAGLAALALRDVRRQPLAVVLAAWTGLVLTATASQGNWWGGWCFGPRLLTEVVPPLALLALLGWQALGARARGFIALPLLAALAWGVVVHAGVGLFRSAAYAWNDAPDIDRVPEFYRWNWLHPQIVASYARNARKAAAAPR